MAVERSSFSRLVSSPLSYNLSGQIIVAIITPSFWWSFIICSAFSHTSRGTLTTAFGVISLRLKKWNYYKTVFLICESRLDYESQLVYFAIPQEWNSSFPTHLTLEPGSPFIYFSFVCLFIQSTLIYEKPTLCLARCLPLRLGGGARLTPKVTV